MKRVLVAVAACVALGAWGQDNIRGMSFFALYERCKNADSASKISNPSPNWRVDGLVCITYSTALIDRYRIFSFDKPNYCLPKDIDNKGIVAAIISLGDDLLKEPKNIERLALASPQGSAPIVFYAALERTYPCPEKK